MLRIEIMGVLKREECLGMVVDLERASLMFLYKECKKRDSTSYLGKNEVCGGKIPTCRILRL